LTNIRRINNWLLLKNEENQKEFTRIETEKGHFLEQIGILKKKSRFFSKFGTCVAYHHEFKMI